MADSGQSGPGQEKYPTERRINIISLSSVLH